MTCQETWPTYKGEARDGVSRIIAKFGFQKDVTYGKTKIFIRTPKTLFALEDERQKKLPAVVIFLQKVICDFFKNLSNLFCVVSYYVTVYENQHIEKGVTEKRVDCSLRGRKDEFAKQRMQFSQETKEFAFQKNGFLT